MPKPDLTKVPSFYHNYISQVEQDNPVDAIAAHIKETTAFLESLPKEKWDHAYAEGKWTIKEMVQHLIDAERVFAYRSLRFSRKDLTPLPGFDENSFAANSRADKRSAAELLEELKTLGLSSLQFFKSLDADQLEFTGISNGNSISVNAIGFIIAGHARHHVRIIKERYL
jgi:uncharacterized damage-inducible protein DinB